VFRQEFLNLERPHPNITQSPIPINGIYPTTPKMERWIPTVPNFQSQTINSFDFIITACPSTYNYIVSNFFSSKAKHKHTIKHSGILPIAYLSFIF
jgi:hypothetical protein